jgi:hypothetical protein
MTTTVESVFDTLWPQYHKVGLHTTPIGPGDKKPAMFAGWVDDVPQYRLTHNWADRPQITLSQPGAGIGLICGRSDNPGWVIVALDFDDDDVALAMYDNLPLSPIGKVGRRAETRFYKAKPGAIASRKFKVDGRCVIEVLSKGAQTVLPPTIHMDTGKPYRWSGDKALPDDWQNILPEITAEIFPVIEEVLRPFGYVAEPEKPAADDGSPFKEFNTFCQKRIDLWVPHLGLTKLVRSGRRYFAYSAVAHWRASSTGRPLEQRAPNLKISRQVIYDHGQGRAYSSLDLVMAALNKTLSEAHTWLDERCGWSERGPDVDWEALGCDDTDEETQNPHEKAKAPGGGPRVFSSAEFILAFTPPDYLIDGVLQRRYLYSYTAMTGSGKTASALYLAYAVACGKPFGVHAVEQGAVCYLAGENPDDVRMRWMAMSERLGFDMNAIDVHFVPGRYPIKKVGHAVQAKAKEIDKQFAFVIVDTSAAFFLGQDENSNAQAGAHARDLRTLVDLPGGPTVLVTCHPTKSPDPENLLPRGGGAYVAEVDGNLVGIKRSDTVTEIYWHGKYRGVDFEPIPFELQRVMADCLKDSKGRPIPTVMAVPLSESAHAKIQAQARADEDAVLLIVLDSEPSETLTHAVIATRCGWLDSDGKPQRYRARNAINRLIPAKLLKRERGELKLTAEGKKTAAKLKRA